ncbi:phosphatidylserine decarboxylase proenzyme 2 [Penicillium sp. IBT 35674x]|nr:phosphatidylserine decarboxylase proenzyme 2 [Penicillium sp. IBT 35674x]
MWLLAKSHALFDADLCQLKLLEDRQVGWLTLDRNEQQALWKKLNLLLLFNPITEWIDQTHALRIWTHKKNLEAGQDEGKPQSHAQIKSFIDFYHIDMGTFEPSDPESYPTFKHFFIPRFAPDARSIFAPEDPTKAIVSADSRAVVYPTVEKNRALWIRENRFTIENLVQDDERSLPWSNGSITSFRLSPQDYHQYDSPVKGKVKWYRHIPGGYLQVDPKVLHSSVDIMTENARSCVCIESEEFSDVRFVAIGATDDRIHDQMRKEGHAVEKGDEIGFFQFGGSSIIVAFEQNRIEFDEDLERFSNEEAMVDVEVGMSLGKATRPGVPPQEEVS